ncbi:MAG: hypothetical protein VX527_05915 [Planctomycetota bacterium]|nr:hypothetical protein [Planctomycetota bacterium]
MLKYLLVKPDDDSPGGKYLDVPRDAEVFTYHQKHSGRTLLAGLVLAAIVEATAIHFLIAIWNDWVALAATLTSVWLALQILAQIRAIGMRPIYIDQGHLMLRNGAFDLADVPLDHVESIERSTRECKRTKGELAPLNVGFPAAHNVILRLKEPMEARILNLKKRDFQVALLAIDDADRFVASIQNAQVAESNG